MDLDKISVCILVKNAQDTILECLNSLQEFGEIILLDNESSDDTLKIASSFNENYKKLKIYSSQFIGFGALKNLALSYASNEWILSIDSDEVLEKEALNALRELKVNENFIIALPRKNLYNKEWIKACGWYPDFVWRVFNKKFTRFNDNFVHESIQIPPNAQTLKLKYGLKHYAFEDMQALINKMNKYSTFSAQEKFKKGKKTTFFSAIVRFFLVFFKDYFLRLGFKYGYKGFVIALLNAQGAFFRYAKLYELQKQEKNLKNKNQKSSL